MCMSDWEDSLDEKLDHINRVAREYEMNDVLNSIGVIWNNNPELRFGQLLANYAFNNYDQLFYQEDDLTRTKLFQALPENQL